MPRRSLLADAPRSATGAQIIHAKRRWNVSAMNLGHRMHRIGLLSDWQVRSTYIQITRRGYRDGEPRGIDRETSQILPKVFAALRDDGITRPQIARELHITTHELNSVTFGLTIAGGAHDPQPSPEPSNTGKPELQIVP
jgi:hypothetical protein